MCARAESGRELRGAVATLADAVGRFAQPAPLAIDDRQRREQPARRPGRP